MTIFLTIIYIILICLWIAGAYDTWDYVFSIDKNEDFVFKHIILFPFVVLALFFFWPVLKLSFFIYNHYCNYHKKLFPDYYGNKLRRKLREKRGDLI